MRQVSVWIVILVVAALTIASCGGGGGDSGGNDQPEAVEINAIDKTTTEPFDMVTISGSGFNPSGALTVNFFGAGGFNVAVPVLEATSTSIQVIVPPFIDMTSGNCQSGTVGISVGQTSAGSTMTSNIIEGLEIAALPALILSPGDVTANVAGFLEMSLTNTIDHLSELESMPGSHIDTQELRSQLESIRLQYGDIKTMVRNAIADPDQADSIGTINDTPIRLDETSLQLADQMMVAILNGVLSQLQQASPASRLNQNGHTTLDTMLSPANLSAECEVNPQLCGSTGQPVLTVLNTRTGEVSAVTQYNYAMALPGASQIWNNITKVFAATTATLGAIAVTTGTGGLPLVAVAAITQVNVVAMSTQFGLDAARLTADADDKEAAKDLLDDFNGTLTYMRDTVLSPFISAFSQNAGIGYDLITGWWSAAEDNIPDVLFQLEDFLDTPPPSGNVTGYWSGTINNPNLGISGCAGGQSYFSISLNEYVDHTLSGSYGSVSISGTRNDYALSINASTSYGNRSYNWSWDGDDALTGSVAYFCWSLETGALLGEGTGTFNVTR